MQAGGRKIFHNSRKKVSTWHGYSGFCTNGFLGDMIEYFRAKEEMERWREAKEKCQADFLNCLRSFSNMRDAWTKAADRNSAPDPPDPYLHRTWSVGHAAFARRQAKMYEQLQARCQRTYDSCAFDEVGEGEILADLVARQRSVSALKDLVFIQAQVNSIKEHEAQLTVSYNV